MTVRLDLNGLLATAARRTGGELGVADLPHRHDDVRAAREAAEEVRGQFDTLVVLGIGGSALGPRALEAALGPAAGGMRVFVADSIDPHAFGALLASLDLTRTLFNVVSKSGETAETLAQFLIVRDRLLRELGAVDYKAHVVITTDAARGALRQIVNDEGFRALPIPSDVGGRFSVLTAVGLFPAAAAGFDVDELVAGAAFMDERSRTAKAALADPVLALAGMLWLLATRHAKTMVVLMPYSDRLAALGDWFCQLWAESLGKARDREGRTVEWGQTPVRALGAADQHSQLQLWVEGPRDKVIVFVRAEDHGVSVDIPAAYQDLEAVAYLGGHSLGELLNAEQRATEMALAAQGRPSATFVVPAVNAFTVGQLIYLFEMATIAVGALAGIDPFGQPGVEEGKRLAYALIGRPNFTARAHEVEAYLARKDPRFIV